MKRLPPRDTKVMVATLALLAFFAGMVSWLTSADWRILEVALWVGLSLVAANVWWWKIPLFPYDRILSAVADQERVVWAREAGIRLDVGGVHASLQVYYPDIVALDGAGYRLYYRAGGEDAFIASAYSSDGITWQEEPGVRIDRGGAWGWHRVESCDVLRWNDGWRMYFSAFDGDCWRIYRAESAYGLDWGYAAVCIGAVGDENAYHAKAPTLIATDSGWRLFYMHSSPSGIDVYTSFSADGDHWQQGRACMGISQGGTVVRNPHVRRLVDGTFRVYFSERETAGSTALGACIRSARSEDGLHWRRESGTRLAPGGEYDRHGIFSIDILPTNEGLRMYYTGYWGRHWLEPLTLLQYRNWQWS